MCRHTHTERGVALVIAVLVLIALSAMGLGLLLLTSTDLAVGAHYRSAQDAIYAADAAIERAIDELLLVTDWTPVLQRTRQSALADGAPTGRRSLGDESFVNLGDAADLINCGHAPCSSADLDAVTSERPWGSNNPRWTLYAYGPLRAFAPGASAGSPVYVLVFVADDPAEDDGHPLVDGEAGTPGAGIIEVRADAYTGGGTHAAIQITLDRPAASARARIAGWRVLR